MKRVSRLSNYKIFCKTVAKKHKFWLCCQIQSKKTLPLPDLEKSNKSHTCLLKDDKNFARDEILRLVPNLSLDTLVHHPKWVKLQSSNLCQGVFVLLQYDEMRPVFGKVFDVIIVNETVVLCAKILWPCVAYPL